MLQLIYISSVKPGAVDINLPMLLARARANNQRQQITGLLYYDGKRFLQALEGPAAEVEALFEHIKADRRHHAVVVLARATVTERRFGTWAMASRAEMTDDAAIDRLIAARVANADPNVRALFESFVKVRAAA